MLNETPNHGITDDFHFLLFVHLHFLFFFVSCVFFLIRFYFYTLVQSDHTVFVFF